MDDRICIPRDRKDDYTWGAASRRRELVKDQTGVDLCQVGQYSFDPDVLRGNIENFVGVIQRLCQPARRSYRRYGPGGRYLSYVGHRGWRMGTKPRTVWLQQPLNQRKPLTHIFNEFSTRVALGLAVRPEDRKNDVSIVCQLFG